VGAGFKVELWDADPGRDDFVGTAITDAGGEYAISHKRQQDPWWYGQKRRRGDFYIKVFAPAGQTFRLVFQSKVHKDCSAEPLTIAVPLSRAVVEHGVYTVYGTVVAKYADGASRPLTRAKVVVKNYGVIDDDTLGEGEVGDDGVFVVPFGELYSRASGKPFKGRPDIFVNVRRYDARGIPRRIWHTRTFREAALPLRVDVEVPVIRVSGEVKSYHKRLEPAAPEPAARPVTDLEAKAWDLDLMAANDFLGECAVEEKAGVGHFDIFIYGSRGDPGEGRELYVELRDKDDGHSAWKSAPYKNVVPPVYIKLNGGEPLEAVDRCWEPPAAAGEGPPGAGTRLVLTNRAQEDRYIYKELFNASEVFITALAPDAQATVEIKCHEEALVRAKRERSDAPAAVTYEVGIVGACREEPLEIAADIWA